MINANNGEISKIRQFDGHWWIFFKLGTVKQLLGLEIEQFFRLLKHTLKIAEAKTKTKDEFERKLFRFAFIGLHVQLFMRVVRKRIKQYRRLGFEQIRRCIIFQVNKIDILDDLLNTPFA